MSVEILSYVPNPRVWKSLIAASFNGIKIKVREIELGRENRTEEFLTMFPFGLVPVAITADKKDGIFESNAIARYVARLGENVFPLYGKSPLESSKIDSWLDSITEYESLIGDWFYPLAKWQEPNEEKEKISKQAVLKFLKSLDRHLKGKEFLVDNSLSLADIGYTAVLSVGMYHLFDKTFKAEIPEVVRFYEKMAAMPQVKSILFPDLAKPLHEWE